MFFFRTLYYLPVTVKAGLSYLLRLFGSFNRFSATEIQYDAKPFEISNLPIAENFNLMDNTRNNVPDSESGASLQCNECRFDSR